MSIVIETYEDGELIGERPAPSPVPPTATDELKERLSALDDRIAALDRRLAGVDAARLARLEERIARAVDRAQDINPNAPSDPGTRGELAKVKQALTPTEGEVT